MLVSDNNEIISAAVSNYNTDAVVAMLAEAGFGIDPTTNWIVSAPNDSTLSKIANSTLYVTLEPSADWRGTARPTIVDTIKQSNIPRVVVGSLDPAPNAQGKGVAALEDAGVIVSLIESLRSECDELIPEYADIARSEVMIRSRYHFQHFGRPFGVLHCSVIDSDNIEAFARNGNAFGTNLGGKFLSYRSFGAYELAPPPDHVWANELDASDYDDYGDFHDASMAEGENYKGDMKATSRIMPWYTKAQAVVTTFPRFGNGPPEDNSVTARLNGLKWLATQGENLPPGVERILVLDAADLKDLPLTNSDPNLPPGVDVEAFWAAKGRKPTRVILRRSGRDTNRAAAAAEAATAAIESSKAVRGVNRLKAARKEAEVLQQKLAELQLLKLQILKVQILKRNLEDRGVIVEAIEDGEPVDVLKHLGAESGLQNVVWRAGCWGERGVRAILAGAFQRVSAHVAVDAIGGKFWQVMIAGTFLFFLYNRIYKIFPSM
jgi:pyrimidine deaminase RibD-like protein